MSRFYSDGADAGHAAEQARRAAAGLPPLSDETTEEAMRRRARATRRRMAQAAMDAGEPWGAASLAQLDGEE